MSHKEIRSQSYKHIRDSRFIHDKEKLLYFPNVKTRRKKRLEQSDVNNVLCSFNYDWAYFTFTFNIVLTAQQFIDKMKEATCIIYRLTSMWINYLEGAHI